MRPDGVTEELRYAFDHDGEVLTRTSRARGTTRFDYDPVGRLIAAVPERARQEVFGFDATGNIFEKPSNREYGPGNKLLERDGVRYRWDGDGRLVEKRARQQDGTDAVWTYAWAGPGLLQSVDTPDGQRVAFAYDPFARRMEKRVMERRPDTSWRLKARTRFVWDDDVLVHEIQEEAGAAGDPVISATSYVFEDHGFAPVAHRQELANDGQGRARGEWLHYLNDTVGTPEALVDSRGEVAARFARSAWGTMQAEDGAKADTPLRFKGQYEDRETGLFYNRCRYYDAQSARYISPDPIGVLGGLNGYDYVDSPLSSVDPYGLKPNGDTFELVDKYPAGSYESRQLRRFAGAWNDEIQQNGGSMTRRCETEQETKDSAAYKAALRKQYPGRFDGKVVGHVPDACAGGPSSGGPVMALDPSVNASIGGQVGGMPVGYTYKRVVVVRP